ncbi:MAG: nucleotidyltransferase domain-containing protein [Candidatus Nanoarchaeia archaeon]
MRKQILKQVLDEISLSKKEQAELLKIGRQACKKLGKQARVGGSLAKGTMIKKAKQDIDIFVKFESEEETSKLGEIVKKANLGEIIERKGSRTYYQIDLNDVILEIVPVVKNGDNVTDISLQHIDYVKKHIGKLTDDVKLAKAFCHACNCYGAESYIHGFSGYALEVLVIYYNGFINFLKKIKPDVLDPAKQFKSKKEILRELNESKLSSLLVVIDPVCKYRNITAGLSEETFNRFLKQAKQFLKKPSKDAFIKKEISREELEKEAEKKQARLLEFRFRTDKQEGDIAATKMSKFFNFLCEEFARKGQKIIRKVFIYNGEEATGYIIFKPKKEIDIKGPELNRKQACKAFKKARKDRKQKVYEKKGRLYAKEKIDLNDLLAHVKQFENDMDVQFELIGSK